MGGKALMRAGINGLAQRSALSRACVGLLVAASLLCALQARAHTRSVSYSTWALDAQGADVTLSMAQLELTRLPWGPGRWWASCWEIKEAQRPGCPFRWRVISPKPGPSSDRPW